MVGERSVSLGTWRSAFCAAAAVIETTRLFLSVGRSLATSVSNDDRPDLGDQTFRVALSQSTKL
jgi:hypothetical protein